MEMSGGERELDLTDLDLEPSLLWSNVVQCGPMWSNVVQCGPMWSNVVHYAFDQITILPLTSHLLTCIIDSALLTGETERAEVLYRLVIVLAATIQLQGTWKQLY